MNILLFVTTLLMAMAIATYGQLESFLDLARLRQQHKNYMGAVELAEYNEKQVAVYEHFSGQSEEDDEEDKSSTEESKPTPSPTPKPGEAPAKIPHKKVDADRKLNIYKLLKPETASSIPEKPSEPAPTDPNATVPASSGARSQHSFKPTPSILKRLLQELYGHALFFQRALEKDPDILDKLLAKLPDSAEIYEVEVDKLKSISQLSEFQIDNEDLWDLFYHILKGTKEFNTESKQGYPPLSKYVKVNEKVQKVRIYLASPEVLTAIYGDPALAKKIVEERERLHSLVKNDQIDSRDATATFQEKFGNHQFVEDDGLDFTVTKTNPK